MRIFGGDRIAGLMTRLRVEDDEAITHVLISRAIENAQKKVEQHHFEIRKHVLEYDDVMNRQREIIYGQRREILGGEVENVLLDMADEVVEEIVAGHTESRHADQWDLEGLKKQFLNTFGQPDEIDWSDQALNAEKIQEGLMAQIERHYAQKKIDLRGLLVQARGTDPTPGDVEHVFHDFERQILLSINDSLWKDHLLSMDYLREGIGLVGYAQKKPIDEYKRAAFEMFTDLMQRINREAVTTFYRAHFGVQAPRPVEKPKQELQFLHGGDGEAPAAPARQPVRKPAKLGRNDLCHCGSGKKYKNCHLLQERRQAVN